MPNPGGPYKADCDIASINEEAKDSTKNPIIGLRR